MTQSERLRSMLEEPGRLRGAEVETICGAADRLEVLEREHQEFFDHWHDERRKREALELLCKQLYEAERTKNQQDWTAVIRAMEKIGAAGTGHNV